jgi:pheromone shutdown-related protein TraB
MINDADRHDLTFGKKEIAILGTAHVSLKSAELVEKTIEDEKPDTVCVELCKSRYMALTQKKRWQDTDLIKVIKEKKASFLLANFMLASIQKKIAEKFGIKPGEEMLRAVHAAESAGSHVHLADRDIRVTLSRVWRTMTFWAKIKLMMQFMLSLGGLDEISEEDVEEMKSKDVLETLLSEIGKSQPQLKKILIDERDQYLTHKIRGAPGKRVVAVVGAGHVPGIKENWNKSVDVEFLEKMPPKGRLSTILKWGIPSAIACLIIAGFFMAGREAGGAMIKYWILANVVFGGLGAALALAHPITILSASIASPITSLNPMIRAGWVAGLVEVFLGKPKVRDFEQLTEDIASIKGFWRNKITRILMVVFFTDMGSALGAYVGIGMMLKILT